MSMGDDKESIEEALDKLKKARQGEKGKTESKQWERLKLASEEASEAIEARRRKERERARLASEEASEAIQEELRKKKKLRRKQATRDDEAQDFFHKYYVKTFFWCARLMLVFLTIMLLIMVFIYFLHMLAPDAWHWLSAQELGKIEYVSISIVITSVISITSTQVAKYKDKGKC